MADVDDDDEQMDDDEEDLVGEGECLLLLNLHFSSTSTLEICLIEAIQLKPNRAIREGKKDSSKWSLQSFLPSASND